MQSVAFQGAVVLLLFFCLFCFALHGFVLHSTILYLQLCDKNAFLFWLLDHSGRIIFLGTVDSTHEVSKLITRNKALPVKPVSFCLLLLAFPNKLWGVDLKNSGSNLEGWI